MSVKSLLKILKRSKRELSLAPSFFIFCNNITYLYVLKFREA